MMEYSNDAALLESLTVMRGQLQVMCETGDKSVLAGEAGQSFQIKIADPCEAVEALDRQIEAISADNSGVEQ